MRYTLILTLSSLLAACGKASDGASNVELYSPTIAGLADDEAFALVEAGAENPVLPASGQLFDGRQTAAFCDVYYAADDGTKKFGTIDDPETTAPACLRRLRHLYSRRTAGAAVRPLQIIRRGDVSSFLGLLLQHCHNTGDQLLFPGHQPFQLDIHRILRKLERASRHFLRMLSEA